MKNTKQRVKNAGKRGRPFPVGNPGRPKGALARFNRSMKEMFMEVFDRLGGADGLYAWATKTDRNRSAFYSFLARLLPQDVNVIQEQKPPRVIVIREDQRPPVVLPGEATLPTVGAGK